jgi:hypothetical protein
LISNTKDWGHDSFHGGCFLLQGAMDYHLLELDADAQPIFTIALPWGNACMSVYPWEQKWPQLFTRSHIRTHPRCRIKLINRSTRDHLLEIESRHSTGCISVNI